MPTLLPPPVAPSKLGRALHDLGVAGLLGGQVFGRFALHPAVSEISDPRERGALTNAAWRRYGVVNGAGLVALLAGWAGARAGEARDAALSPREQRLARAKDVLVGAVAITGTATGIEGMRFSRLAPGGAVPLADGDHTAPGATEEQARAKRRLNVLGLAAIATEAALVVVNAALAQEGFRRPPVRRRFLPGV
jgi:hypothetical protein